MRVEEQIDFMIASLQIAKEELEYARKFKKEKDRDNTIGASWWASYSYNHRNPNGTLIRENLKQVGRMANIVSQRIKLSQYNDEITD